MADVSKEMSQLMSQTASLSCFEDALFLDGDVLTTSERVTKTTLVGKVIDGKEISVSVIKEITLRASFICPNTFLFNFWKEKDQKKVLEQRPW